MTNSLSLLETQSSSTRQVTEGRCFYELPGYQHRENGVLFYTPQVPSSNALWPRSLGDWSINGGNSWQVGCFEDGQLALRMDGGTTLNSISVGGAAPTCCTAPAANSSGMRTPRGAWGDPSALSKGNFLARRTFARWEAHRLPQRGNKTGSSGKSVGNWRAQGRG